MNQMQHIQQHQHQHMLQDEPIRKKRKYGNNDLQHVQPTTLVKPTNKNQSQANRFSQACDRCRLKKIKCDGIKPNCSQCSKVKFICKTSDKLTRRGFPRGYTEMLEKEVVFLQSKLDCLSSNGNMSDIKHSDVLRDPLQKNRNNKRININHYWAQINSFSKVTEKSDFIDKSWLNSYQLLILSTTLQLNSQFNYLPIFLINKYNMDIEKLNSLISVSIKNFNNLQNSVLPILYPFKDIEISLSLTDKIFTDYSINLLIICYIIQLNWSCFDNYKLYQLTKFIYSTSIKDFNDNNQDDEENIEILLKLLQLLNLSMYFFITTIDSNNSIFVKELMTITVDFINQKIILKKQFNEISTSQNYIKLITIECSRTLITWWSMLNGIEDNNLLITNNQDNDIYDDKILMNPKYKDLKPFLILSQFIKKSFNSYDEDEDEYTLENFKQCLIKENLFFNNNENFLEQSLSKKDSIKLQMSLYYLILSIFENAEDITSDSFIENPNKIETSFQILLTYYNLLIDGNLSLKQQPQQFQLLYFLPIQNNEIIQFALNHLNSWSKKNDKNFNNDLELPINWDLLRYQTFLIRFCSIWYYDDLKNPLLLDLQNNFRFNIKHTISTNILNFTNFNRLGYLQSVTNFNDTSKLLKSSNISFVFGRSNLLKSNSNARMDHFNMFTNVEDRIDSPTQNNDNINLNTNLSPLNPTILDSLSLKPFSQNNSNTNIIDMSKYQSQILLNQDETDDGYAEDDDEEDEVESGKFEDNKPLEIPFKSKRHNSLFQTRHIKPPSHHLMGTELPLTQNKLDHIILSNLSTKQNTASSPNNDNMAGNNINTDAMHMPVQVEADSRSMGGLSVANINDQNNNISMIETPRSFTDMLLLQSSSQLNLLRNKQLSSAFIKNSFNNNTDNSNTHAFMTIPSLLSVEKLYEK